jgi:hypothetical protein
MGARVLTGRVCEKGDRRGVGEVVVWDSLIGYTSVILGHARPR